MVLSGNTDTDNNRSFLAKTFYQTDLKICLKIHLEKNIA